MRRAEIITWLNSIKKSLGPIRKPVSEVELRNCFGKRDFAGMLNIVRKAFGLNLTLRLFAHVRSGGPEGAPAWVAIPTNMPPYGSLAFQNLTINVYFRETFMRGANFESVVIAMAHELAHIVLEAVGQQYKKLEPVVDLAAMHLGFYDFFVNHPVYREEIIVEEKPRAGVLGRLLDSLFGVPYEIGTRKELLYAVGYLTDEERHYAASLMRG